MDRSAARRISFLTASSEKYAAWRVFPSGDSVERLSHFSRWALGITRCTVCPSGACADADRANSNISSCDPYHLAASAWIMELCAATCPRCLRGTSPKRLLISGCPSRSEEHTSEL